MSSNTLFLAKKITKANSLQTYYTIKFLVDRGLNGDAFKAYAYFRWFDDQVDDNLATKAQRVELVRRQKRIINSSYLRKEVENLLPEEQMIKEVIFSDKRTNPRLESFIRNFLAIIEFDAKRRGRRINPQELSWYTKTLGKAVTDCIEYFIGNKSQYPDSVYKYRAATAAHITHILRDQEKDSLLGYFNVLPEKDEILKQVKLARTYFQQGREYIRKIPNFRCKVAAYLYCVRFERLLAKYD